VVLPVHQALIWDEVETVELSRGRNVVENRLYSSMFLNGTFYALACLLGLKILIGNLQGFITAFNAVARLRPSGPEYHEEYGQQLESTK
jgi:hypothetical protein